MDNQSNNSEKKSTVINTDEKVCYNCKHMSWMVAIGVGVRCKKNIKNNWPTVIPSLRHTCELFEMNEDKNRKPFIN